MSNSSILEIAESEKSQLDKFKDLAREVVADIDIKRFAACEPASGCFAR